MKKAHIIAVVIAVIVIIIVAIVAGPYIMARSWGANGELTLTISADKTTMDIDGTITVDYVLANTGSTDLRIVEPWGYNVDVSHANGTSVEWTGPSYAPPADPTDETLTVLKAGRSVTRTYAISNRSWALEQGKTYKAQGAYFSDKHSSVTLPYWTGELRSNEITFSVT